MWLANKTDRVSPRASEQGKHALPTARPCERAPKRRLFGPLRGNASRTQKMHRVRVCWVGDEHFTSTKSESEVRCCQAKHAPPTNGSRVWTWCTAPPDTVLKSASEIFQRTRRVPRTARVDLRANAPDVTEAELDERSHRKATIHGSTAVEEEKKKKVHKLSVGVTRIRWPD